MLVRRCPHCDLPLLADEITDGLCPTCGQVVEEPVLVEEPKPLPPPPPGWGRFWLGSAAGAAFIFFIVWPLAALFTPASASREELETARTEKTEAEEGRQTALAARNMAERKFAALEKTLQTTSAEKAAADEDVKKEKAAKKLAVEQRNTLLNQFNELKGSFDALQATRWPATRVSNVNNPGAEYQLPPMTTATGVKLIGQVKTLKVPTVTNGAYLDATEFQAREIVFLGPINGGARVRLAGTNTKVTIPEINGKASVDIRVPGGSVVIRVINGDAQVTITTKEIDLADFVDGDRTQATVTLNAGGLLRFNDLRGSSRLLWRKEKPGDPDPRIDQGKIKPAAEFRRLD